VASQSRMTAEHDPRHEAGKTLADEQRGGEMSIGCVYPNRGPMATPEHLVRFAHTAEALGFETIWTSDHIVVPTEVKSGYPLKAGQFMTSTP
jgi:alkanesulfonate monooxygenase SsuD/methylene tetrahydromethanopterin reductase-like flavin-dependent oxidoreductase (luciferase family)